MASNNGLELAKVLEKNTGKIILL